MMLRRLFKYIYCLKCNRIRFSIRRRRQNTAYVDYESNFICVCSECFDEVQEYWRERWDEYYGGCL